MVTETTRASQPHLVREVHYGLPYLQATVTHPSPRSGSRLLPRLLVGLILLASVYAVVRAVIPQPPRPFVQARAVPQNALWHGGAWYWIESRKGEPARLVRADAGGLRDVASADEIGGFAFTPAGVAWSARRENRWTIATAGANNASPRDLRPAAPAQPLGLCSSEGRLYWMETTPAAIADCAALPPLGPATRILSMDVTGGPIGTVGTLMEPEGQQILGVASQSLYVSTFRPGALGTTAFYRIPLAGGPPQRLAGTPGRQKGILTRDGALYWVAASREASTPGSTSCVRRIGRNDAPETLSEWLPSGGRLVETDRGIVYVDGAYVSRAWPVGSARELPHRIPVPEDFSVMGINGSEALIRPITEEHPGTISLSRMALP